MSRLSKVLIAAAAFTLAVPAVTGTTDAWAETKKQKKAREAKEKADAEAKAAAEAEAAAAAEAEAAAAAEKAAAEAAAAPPEGGGEGGGTATATVEASIGGSTGSWSMSFIDRPLNLLKGMIRVDIGSGFAKVFTPAVVGPPAVPASSVNTIPLSVGAGYGISDKLEAGVNYGLSLNPFEAKGKLSLYGLFSLVHTAKMRISAGAAFGFKSVPDGPGISAGLAFQYHLGPKMMVFMTPSHLNVGLDPVTASINLPVGFGFQATPNIFASAQTNLFNLNLKPSGGNTFIGADATPLIVTASYSPSNKMDLGASIGTGNVPDIADDIAIGVFARLYLGSVPTSGSAAAAAVDPATDMTPPAE